jgi:hypothetical protein
MITRNAIITQIHQEILPTLFFLAVPEEDTCLSARRVELHRVLAILKK